MTNDHSGHRRRDDFSMLATLAASRRILTGALKRVWARPYLIVNTQFDGFLGHLEHLFVTGLRGTILFCPKTVSFLSCIFHFLGVFEGGSMLLEGCFRSFLKKCVNTLIKIVRGHIVINYAQTGNVYGALIAATGNIIVGFG